MSRLLRIKPMSMLSEEARETGEHTLKRSLGALNLVTLGIGAVIGAGIFTLTGQAAALARGSGRGSELRAGRAHLRIRGLVLRGVRFHHSHRRARPTPTAMRPWANLWRGLSDGTLTLEYAFGASTVASGWAGYFNSLLQQFHIYIPPQLTATTGTPLVFYHDQWLQLMSLPPGVSAEGLPHATGVFNLIAVCIVMVITTILVIGIKESANFNSAW